MVPPGVVAGVGAVPVGPGYQFKVPVAAGVAVNGTAVAFSQNTTGATVGAAGEALISTVLLAVAEAQPPDAAIKLVMV